MRHMGAGTRKPHRQSSRVVSITEYLAARAPRQARLWEDPLPGQPAASLSTRAVAHRARMLAHLAAQPRKAGA